MSNPHVERLFEACPFLRAHITDPDILDLATIVFGGTAGLLIEHRLFASEEDQVFNYFNSLASHGTEEERQILGTGAIELFNDTPQAQRLARRKLKGAALGMLEELREYFGQPDYGNAA
ncbi:hypothetical protein HNP52_001408 [Sphingomonas kyeonggiensis]|uniref:Uncharacterized protein n=1 Tax=Sphingomonas kyeonggiensis TaxID=1268553 RepID=A0A7W7JZP1_9SPHN|nr:hypothetical protein [Sphingomonas kyeonggiensis]MBB4838357.1 hypothetical protein [Sphingomonas kyeonggiensis]